MNIDKTTHSLTKNNYYDLCHDKKQIVIGHSSFSDMKHLLGWKNRYNGTNKKTAMFSIDIDGNIYQHFDPRYYSDFIGDKREDIKTISIILDNVGWLTKNDNNEYITWNGDIYRNESNIKQIKWRNYEFWVKYSDEQFNSLVFLTNKLILDFKIDREIVYHNTQITTDLGRPNVLYRSNLDKNNLDLNPTWDYIQFKKQVK